VVLFLISKDDLASNRGVRLSPGMNSFTILGVQHDSQDSLLVQQCSKLAVLVVLTTSTVALTAQETLAIPLEPILDQMGRCMIRGLVGTDSGNQATPPDSQPLTDTQQEGTQQETDSPLEYPAYSPPTHPSSYPAYPPARSSPPGIINNF
jgi:hypothetical protein